MSLKQKMKKAIRKLLYLIKEEKKVPIPVQINTSELLAGKIALISGGTGGIGIAIAENFLKNGAKVIITGSNENSVNSALNKLKQKDTRYETLIKGMVLNLFDVSSFPDKINDAVSLFEEKRIDILVNSAGLLNKNKFLNTTEEEYDNIMGVNLKGVYFLCQSTARYMISNKVKGHILNVSSSSSLRPAWMPYQISKWGLRGFTLGLADTLLPYGIIVNAIAPGPVATSMLHREEGDTLDNQRTISGRYAEPSEIANLAAFMVSDMGNLIVGDTYYITGGSGTISYHK